MHAESRINGTPSGDIATMIDWNVTDPSGGPLSRFGTASGPLRGSGDFVIGTFRGAAQTEVVGANLLTKAFKTLVRTDNQIGVNNSTSLPTNATAFGRDLLSFSGPGGAFSFKLVPVFILATDTLGLNFTGGTDLDFLAPYNLANLERNARTEGQLTFSGVVLNANNTLLTVFPNLC